MMVNKTFRFLLFVLIVIISWIDLQYMYKQPIWGDVDEIAHFDYIEKISNGNLKYDNDVFIEKEVLQSLSELHWKKPENYNGDIHQIGLTGISYELHQPPLYYGLMSIPNIIAKWMQVDISERVLLIRIISWLLFLAGIFIGFLLIKKVQKDAFGNIKIPLGEIFIIFSICAGAYDRYGVSNDVISVTVINLHFWIFYRFIKHNSNSLFLLVQVSILLILFSKQTNWPIAFVSWALCLYLKLKKDRFNFCQLLISLCIYIPFIIYLIIFITQQTEISVSKSIFNSYLPAGIFDFNSFIQILFENTFDLQIFHLNPFLWRPWILIIFILQLISITWLSLKNIVFRLSLVYLIILTIMMFVLNKWVGGVHWYAFRHYTGYSLIIFLFIISPIILTERLITRKYII
jgi:hypothetical protein